MSSIERTLKNIRPSLRLAAPQTYWFSIGFGLFNVFVGLALYNLKILVTLNLVGIIPINVWGLIFLFHGVSILFSLFANNWKLTRYLNILGVAIKTAWWLELASITLIGRSPFLLYVWSLLLFFQVINCIYFMPRVRRE